MTRPGSIVTLGDGLVGVVSEIVPGARGNECRVGFPDGTSLVVAPNQISETLDAPHYSIGDTVEVWPVIGTITAIDGETITMELDRSRRIEGVGHIQWQPTATVPLWRIILDNDPRLGRNWA